MRRPALAACILLAGCCPRHLPPQVEVRDSIVIRTREVHDTVSVEVPLIVERTVTRDTVSHLQNQWAESEASVEGGLLRHSLASRPQRIYVPVEVTVHDTLRVHGETTVVTEYVEREQTRTQKGLMTLGRAAALALALGLLALVLKVVLKR